ncbi:TIGR04104 family putative zinc finger protein [Cytobacillus sp. FSL R7-0680]|uniref:TIGR04104 family putative zinc finger protein n=1 Tax=Cytobacillus sp. FSL R7-0680 TaxID=2921689 RepID=UPI0040403565
MPICQHCHHKWSWMQTFKRLFTIRRAIKCMYCGENQYQSVRSRKVTFFLPLVSSFMIAFIYLFNPWQTIVYLFSGFIFILICLVMPFFIRFIKDDDVM